MSKKSLIDSIEVKTPCSESWNEMKGNDKVRFCSHCAFEVNNISGLTRKQAMRLVRDSDGRICVRYIKSPVTNKPVFAEKFYQITRRAGITAGVLGASLTLSTLTYAQGGDAGEIKPAETQTEVSLEKKDKEETTESGTASLSGTVTDPNGAVIPGVTVTLLKDGVQVRAATSNDEGFYEFKDIPGGNYAIVFQGNYGFKTANAAQEIKEDANVVVDISLEIGEQMMTMGIMITTTYSSPMQVAVSNNDIEAVRDLIAKGEDPNVKEESYGNITPLFTAVENGYTEIAETLLSFGARVNAKDDRKQTPLMRLDEDATPELVRLLIKHGAKINSTDAEGNTVLILAAGSVKAEVLQILLDHGAAVNRQNKQGQTALMNAAEADNVESVRALIIAGANVNLKNKDGETAWDLTASDEIEQLLESHGAIVEDN
jgi:ankyrin repeat protein